MVLKAVAFAEDEESDGLSNDGNNVELLADEKLMSINEVLAFVRSLDGHDLARRTIRERFLGQDDVEVYIPKDLCYGDCDDAHVDGHDECKSEGESGEDDRYQSRFEVKCLPKDLTVAKHDDGMFEHQILDARLHTSIWVAGIDFAVQSSGCHDDTDHYAVSIYVIRVL